MELRVKEICKEKSILFKDLAAELGITDAGLRQQVNGNPTIESLEKIAKALDVEFQELFVFKSIQAICPRCGETITVELK